MECVVSSSNTTSGDLCLMHDASTSASKPRRRDVERETALTVNRPSETVPTNLRMETLEEAMMSKRCR